MPLLGRDEEIQALDALLDRGLADGAIGLIEGEPGIGKTSLLDVVAERAREREAMVLRARASEHERGLAFGVARQLLERPVSALGRSARTRVLTGAARAGLPAVDPSEEAGVPAHPLQAAHGLYWLCANLATDRPLVLVVDDVHWSDAESLVWLGYLARRVEGTRITVVCASWHDEAVRSQLGELPSAPGPQVISPTPLGTVEAAAILAAAQAAPPDSAFVAAALAATGGNPFLLEEIARSQSQEDSAPSGSRARLPETPPETVRHHVAARLRRLSAGARGLAEAISVLGDGCLGGDAATLAGLDPQTAMKAEEELRDAGFLGSEAEFAFRHPILRAAVYSGISRGRCAAHHARAAEILLTRGAREEIVASQLLRTEPRGDAGAARCLANAGRDALERGAPTPAVQLLERALAEPPATDDRPAVLRGLGIAGLRTGQAWAVDRLREALALTDRPDERVAVTREASLALLTSGQVADAFEVLASELDSPSSVDSSTALALAGDVCSIGFVSAETAPQAAARVLELAPGLRGEAPGERVLLALLAWLQSMSGAPLQDALSTAERALANGQLVSDQIPDGPALYMAADVLVDGERFELYDRVLSLAFADARARGSELGFATASTFRAHGNWYRGAVAETASDAASGLEAARAAWKIGIPMASAYLVAALTERAELDLGERTLADSGLDGELDLSTLFAGLVLFHRGVLRLAQGRVAEAVDDLLAQIDWEQSMGRSASGLQARALVAPVLAARGERDRGLELAEAEWEGVRDVSVPRWPGVALRGLGLARGGDDGIELLRESVTLLSNSAAQLEYARSQVEYGAALRRANHRKDAREPLRAGMDLAKRRGALALAARAHDELRATGARPRSAVLTGVESLTPSELRIARMAADGMSNPEIAQALFVTRKAVERHLSGAYRKLDISSREELAAALRHEVSGRAV